MLIRNWIEFILMLALFIFEIFGWYLFRKRAKKADGFKGINKKKQGHGWKFQ